MELILEKSLPHQQKAVDSINKVFKGVTFEQAPIQESNPVFNLKDVALNHNIQIIQDINKIRSDYKGCQENLSYLPIDIKMETGTGKTYVYTQTIFELHKNYGFNKFIIVVPSLPIKSGTKNFIGDNQVFHHFADDCGYNTKISLSVLERQKANSKKNKNFPIAVANFVNGSNQNSNTIFVLLVNMSLLTNGKMLSDTYDSNMFGDFDRPFDALKQTKPIVIIDEPHRFDKDNKAMNIIINELCPQSIIRFGATFPELKNTKKDKNKLVKTKDYNNLVYDLNAFDSLSQGLIKQVKKIHIDFGENTQLEKVKLVSVDTKKTANFQLIKDKENKKTFKLGKNDSLSVISQNLSGITIEEIGKNFVVLNNGTKKITGEEFSTDVYSSSYQEAMLKASIQQHFKIERENFNKSPKIKTLALYFIDDIDSYRQSDEKQAYLKDTFERLLKEQIEKELEHIEQWEMPYKEFLQASLNDISNCHAGYFSQDNSDSDEDIAKEVDDILNNKKKLLSVKDENGNYNIRRFLFSKWTLKEGWDNPNIFTITKLRSSGSEISKLQEVGRGLRLPVNEYGTRISNSPFALQYIVDFTEADFINNLIKEVNGELQESFVLSDELVEKYLKETAENTTRNDFLTKLLRDGYIDFDRNIDLDKKEEFFEKYPQLFTQKQTTLFTKLSDENKQKNKVVTIRKEKYNELKELWETINQTYYLFVDKDVDTKIDDELLAILKTRNVFVQDVMRSVTDGFTTNSGELELQSIATQEYLTSRKMEYSKFLKKISNATNVPISALHKAMVSYNKTNKIKDENICESTCNKIIRQINDWKANAFLHNFTYSKSKQIKIHTTLTNEDGTPKENIQSHLVGTVYSGKTPAQYLYDQIAADSNIEKSNIETEIDKITVYAKIPRKSISIPTITGENYSPDFMYVVEQKDGSKKLNLIIESKDMPNEESLRGKEAKKIECAKAFFEQIAKDNNNFVVRFRKQLSGDNIIQFINQIQSE